MAKMRSTTRLPVSTPAAAGPSQETSGKSAPGSTWRTSTRLSGNPLARAVRT